MGIKPNLCPMPDAQLPIPNYPFPITYSQLPIPNFHRVCPERELIFLY
ncbi:MAG: alpha/beta hydrolase [Tolypothrix carrinoi HA7290-LM1]|nr:alpha/beta hydrolase [Tolypothrix carrinoi HA7290-LM1]